MGAVRNRRLRVDVMSGRRFLGSREFVVASRAGQRQYEGSRHVSRPLPPETVAYFV